jgi:uncharacterized protein with PIN domain
MAVITKSEKERLHQRFMAKAEEVFEKAIASGTQAEELSLSEIEETVEGLKFELTGTLVAGVVEVRNKGERGPGPRCERCGCEMRYKGKKRREVVTSQGKIELERAYYYCKKCRVGIFPPGSAIEDQPEGVE